MTMADAETGASNLASVKAIGPSTTSVAAALDDVLARVGRRPARGATWSVKLNLTYPAYLPGAVNSPLFVEGLCLWAHDNGVTLHFIEGDGGNGAYSAADAFAGTGVTGIADRYGMQCLSVSERPWIWKETQVGNRVVRLPYSPYFERREFDALITMPLFKNHIFTVVSLGMKNLWGCIPDAYRMYYHHVLDAGIVALQKELRPDFSIFDGHIALRGRGPIDGSPFEYNTVMASSDVGTGELAALELMGIGIEMVKHLQIARFERIVPDKVHWVGEAAPFVRSDFILNRTLLNHLSIHVGKWPLLQNLIYHSPLSTIVYAMVDRLRPSSPQAELVQAKKAGKYHSIDFPGPKDRESQPGSSLRPGHGE
jgi:uncharacterized protein (DUF362 family)